MKKSIFGLAVAAAVALLASCGTTSSVKGSGVSGRAASVSMGHVDIIDYQGGTFGSEIPAWVKAIGDGNYSSEYLSTVMPGVKNKKTFVVLSRGDNLEFTQQWADLVDVEVQVGDEMQRIVGKAVSAAQKGRAKAEGTKVDPTQSERELNMYKQAVSAVELNGLEKIASYWVLKEVKANKKAVESNVYYEYYAVWGMNQKIYDQQLAQALSNIQDNTDEGKALKETLSLKLQNMMITSNDDSVNDSAYELN